MKKKLKLLTIGMGVILAGLISCDRNNTIEIEKPFDVQNYVMAGTREPLKGSFYRSVYFIQFLQNNRAAITDNRQITLADYVATKDSIIVSCITKGDSLVYKYSLDARKQISSAFYKSYTMESKATATLFPLNDGNSLAGKVFKGEEFVMGNKSFRKDLYYKFSADGKSFGTGNDITAIDDKMYPYELINAIGFKSKVGNTTQTGFLTDSLTVFRTVTNGLYYFGNYARQ